MEKGDKLLTESVTPADSGSELDDSNSSTARDLDEYVKVMTSLRGGSRPILCW